MKTGFVAVLSCAVVAPLAGAQLVLTSDERALVVEAAGSIQTAFPAPAFSAFNREISRDVPSGGGNGKARAAQISAVSASVLSATGSSSAESLAGPANCVLSQTTSEYRIAFKVLTPVEYLLAGAVEGAQFRLAEPVDGAIHLVQAQPGTSVPYAFSGVLKPGRSYTVLAQSSHLANACAGTFFSLEGEYTLSGSFVSLPPCPGDLNFDRVVDDADFALFAPAYNELLCPNPPLFCDADLNSDGFVDDADFAIFAPAYNELVCP
jgi:hypothetical protein